MYAHVKVSVHYTGRRRNSAVRTIQWRVARYLVFEMDQRAHRADQLVETLPVRSDPIDFHFKCTV